MHARHLRRQARRSFLLFGSGAVLALACAAVAFLVGVRGAPLWMLSGFSVVAAVVCWALADRSRVRILQLAAGIRAEKLTASRLEKLSVTAVVHDVVLAAGDVDQGVLGPVCVAVETKYGQGPVTIAQDKVQVGRKVLKGHPLTQARRSADAVARAIRVPCLPILVISGASGPPQLCAGVWVSSPDHLPGIIASMPHVMDPVSAHASAHRLHEMSQQRQTAS